MVLVYHQVLLIHDVVKTCPSLKPIFAVQVVRKYWILSSVQQHPVGKEGSMMPFWMGAGREMVSSDEAAWTAFFRYRKYTFHLPLNRSGF